MNEDHLTQFDITLVVKDGKEFQAHRNFLSQGSPFFEKLLNTDMKENIEGVIRLEWITESQMADILQFIYTGNVQISTLEKAENLFETADYLLLPNLKVTASKFLEQHMTSLNCISIYYVAEQYSCEELIASTRKFINSNFTTVAASDEFLKLPSHEVEKWISSDEIVIDAEENIFEIILRWIDHHKSARERSIKFGELFRHVRLTCVSRDFLPNDIVTNDLVKGNEDCLDSVRSALKWFDRPIDCDVPRPHSPRKALELNVIVITACEYQKPFHTILYVPSTDEWYRLPAHEDCLVTHVVSCQSKLFVVTRNIARSQCYDPDLNRWSLAPWTMDANREFLSYTKQHFLQDVLVVRNKICFIVGDALDLPALWTYNPDETSMAPLFEWVEKKYFCAVAVDRYIYVVGGVRKFYDLNDPSAVVYLLSECARFDSEENTWQKIAPLKEARRDAFGVSKKEKIFIAGGVGASENFLNSCEVYNTLTDEWQFIASLTIPRILGNIVLLDETLYVMGGITKKPRKRSGEFSDKVECYDHARDEWNNKATVPVSKITIEKRELLRYYLKGCSLRVLKGVIKNLEPIL
ncbi:kelch-like protein 24 [Oculina patagonica]